MPAVVCDKCGQKQEIPSRNHMVCNQHIVSEPTGYCQGRLHPEGQVANKVWTPPAAGVKELYQNQ